MIVRCLHNSGESLRLYEYQHLDKGSVGRFGASGHTLYNNLKLGKRYLVMGLVIFETYQAYLLDSEGFTFTAPCQLFEIIDSEINQSWHFRLMDKEENIYPFIQSIIGYPELCSDKKAYEKLIVDRDEESHRIYFRRKTEAEKLDLNSC